MNGGDDGDEGNVDTMAPSSPSGLSKTAGDGTVDLNWNGVDASDLDGYNVYRSTSSIGDVSGESPLNGSLVSDTSYTDSGAENGTTYYYVVSAVDTAGNESGGSGEVTASPTTTSSSDNLIAFASDPDDIDGINDTDGDTEIYTAGPDGSGLRQVTDNIVSSANPAWSPDGSRIAFTSDRDQDGNGEIYTARLDGSDLRQVTDPENVEDGQVADILPDWSPSGDRIALARDPDTTTRDTTATRIYTVNPDGSDLRQVAKRAAGFSPAWSPDGSRIAFSSAGSEEIFTIRPDGSGLKQVTDRSNVNGTFGDIGPVWSPDGSRIAFQSDRDEDTTSEIYTVDPDGSDLKQVTTAGDRDSLVVDITPAWSPDGNRIAFGRARDGSPSYDIYTIRPDGSELKRITDNDRFDYSPAWSPSQ